MGPRTRAAEAEIDLDITEWVDSQNVEAYRKAMRGSVWYQAVQLSDAILAPLDAVIRLIRLPRP